MAPTTRGAGGDSNGSNYTWRDNSGGDPSILVVLAQIVPTRTDGTNNAVKTYNAAMSNLVSTRVGQGQHVILVDMYGAFTKDASYKQSLLADNLHPNQAGYNAMADVWFQALSPYLR